MESPTPLVVREKRLPLLFYLEVCVCNNPIEGQYYTVDYKPTRKGGQSMSASIVLLVINLYMVNTLMESRGKGGARNIFQFAKLA